MNTGGIAVLSRQQPITNEEWLAFVNIRWQLIRPHLSRFQLTKLGEFNFLTSERSAHLAPLWVFHPLVSGKRFSLDTRGLFFCGGTKHLRESPYHKIKFVWGITASGQWLLVRVAVCDELDPYGSRGSTHEVAKSVQIKETSLVKLLIVLKLHPRTVWQKLGFALVQHTRAKTETNRRLRTIVETEELILQHVPT